MILRWFLSKTVRQAVDLRGQVVKLLNAQRDILSTEAVQAIEAGACELQKAIATGADKKALLAAMEEAEKVANKWLKPYPSASMRENVEVVLVAIAVAMGVRTFFLQPFKIPTGSMQPTLYGITHVDHRGDPNYRMPTGFGAFVDSWFRGVSHYRVVAEADGEFADEFTDVRKPQMVFPFVHKQQFRVGGVWYSVWFPPDQLFGGENRSGITRGQSFRKGDDILNLSVITGDHLFVDRMSYNFRRPRRGEIIVFETKGIEGLPQDQFYIKRMVAIGDEHVRLGNDRHLRINGVRLDSATPHFENVYHFTGQPRRNEYSGHVNEFVARESGRHSLAPKFMDETQEFVMRPQHYLVMGDNTMNSHDSRAWGDFSQTNVIGKSCFVYWPFSSPTGSRFGWSHR